MNPTDNVNSGEEEVVRQENRLGIRTMCEVMLYLMAFMCDRDAYALALTCFALRESVMPLLQLRYRHRTVRLYSGSGVYESDDEDCDDPHILQTADCVLRIKLPPVLVQEQRYLLETLKSVKAKVRKSANCDVIRTRAL